MNNFDTVRVGCLATINADGTPRATPLHFLLTETELVWLSYETAVHSQNIARGSKASFATWESTTVATRVDGVARVASGDEAERLTQLYRDKIGGSPSLDGALVYVIERK